MSGRVVLPSQFRADTLFPLIQKEFGRFQSIPKEVTFDFSQMWFVFPSGMVFLNNLSRFLRRSGCKVKYVGVDTKRDCIRFMDDSQFFKQHSGSPLLLTSGPRPTTRPLMEIHNKDVHGWIDLNFLPWLSRCCDIPVKDLAELGTCVKELFNNIADHTEHDVGSIFAQWYPKLNELEVCIADFGAGIPSTVRRVEPELHDADAIVRAFEEGFTSRSRPTNMGAGLYILRQNVVDNLSGCLTIRSARGVVQMQKSGTRTEIVPYDTKGYCPGTMFEIKLRTDRIEKSDQEPEEFQW